MVREIERAGAVHVTLPLDTKNPLGIRRNIARLARLIETQNIDLVHARSRAPAWSAFYAAQRTGRRFVTTFHNIYGGETRLKRAYNGVMARGERVIAISDFVGAHAKAVYHVNPSQLRVIPRGVDLVRFDPESISQPRIITLAKEWRLQDGLPVVMLPGRVTPLEGPSAADRSGRPHAASRAAGAVRRHRRCQAGLPPRAGSAHRPARPRRACSISSANAGTCRRR